MENDKIIYYPNNKPDTLFEELLESLSAESDLTSLMVLMTENCDAKGFLERFEGLDLKVWGGLFPGVIYEGNKQNSGLLIVKIACEFDIKVLKGIDDQDYNLEMHLSPTLIEEEYTTVFVFVDGFSEGISNLIEELFNLYGIELSFIGGGAGSLNVKLNHCLFTNEGLFSNGAIIAALKSKSSIAVRHGWELLDGPVKVSLANKNVVKVLNNKPAFTYYKNIVEEDSKGTIEMESFFSKAKAYPFGLSKLGSEYIVRDPISVIDNEAILCVGDVPQNSLVNILKGDKEKLIKAVGEAVDKAKSNMPDHTEPKISFVVDCISRVLFLEDDFSKELNTLFSSKLPTFGILSIGEIANSGKDYLEFYNKTCVVSFFDKL